MLGARRYRSYGRWIRRMSSRLAGRARAQVDFPVVLGAGPNNPERRQEWGDPKKRPTANREPARRRPLLFTGSLKWRRCRCSSSRGDAAGEKETVEASRGGSRERRVVLLQVRQGTSTGRCRRWTRNGGGRERSGRGERAAGGWAVGLDYRQTQTNVINGIRLQCNEVP
jgi:hypothetical protein